MAAAEAFVRDCAAALLEASPPSPAAAAPGSPAPPSRPGPRGAVLYLGGGALRAEGGALEAAGRVAAVTGAALLAENAFAAADRGAGRAALRRLPYFPQVGPGGGPTGV